MIAILYGALVALVQPDMKKLIAYSSVSHMAFVTLGIFVLNIQGLDGAMLVMLAHGFNTGALFLLVGVVYERAHTRLIANFSGLAAVIPMWSGFFVLFMLASIGLPGLSGFPGEFLVALGAWNYNPWVAALTFAVVIFAAWYMMYLTQRVVWGRPKGVMPDPGDGALTPTEAALLAAAAPSRPRSRRRASGSASGTSCRASPAGRGALPDARIPEADRRELTTSMAGTPAPAARCPAKNGRSGPTSRVKELLTLLPLAVLTICLGVYPQAVLDHRASRHCSAFSPW